MKQARVLLADDHVLFREGLAGIIGNQPDMQVVGEANDGLEAFVKAQELKPDLILMDVQMPVMDGYEAARLLRERGFARPIIALTAHATREHIGMAKGAGCDLFLSKPVTRSRLIETIAGLSTFS